jgi:hypothetical protein
MTRRSHGILAILFGGVLFALGWTASGADEGPGPLPSASDSSAVAVVELFTSEGCSSCPPADRLLRTLVDDARVDLRSEA